MLLRAVLRLARIFRAARSGANEELVGRKLEFARVVGSPDAHANQTSPGDPQGLDAC